MSETTRTNSTRDRLARLLRLVLSLRTERFPTANDLALDCDVSRRTIFRDLEVLERAGFPVKYRGDRQGYQLVAAPGQPAVLNEREALALLLFTRRAEVDAGRLGSLAREAARKIVNSLGDETRGRVVELSELIVIQDPVEPLGERESEIYDAIVASLASRRQARVRLKSNFNPGAEPNWDVESTKLSPYRLVAFQGAWRLIARSSWHRRVVLLRLDALQEVRLTDDLYEIPPRFDHARFLESILGAPPATPPAPRRVPHPHGRVRNRTSDAPPISLPSKLLERNDRSVVDDAGDLGTIGLPNRSGA